MLVGRSMPVLHLDLVAVLAVVEDFGLAQQLLHRMLFSAHLPLVECAGVLVRRRVAFDRAHLGIIKIANSTLHSIRNFISHYLRRPPQLTRLAVRA